MTQQLPSVCTLDCPDTCSLTVTVEGGEVTKVRGSRANPLTRGSICAKVTRYPELLHGEGRLRTPLRRTGPKGQGRFAPISWEEALDEIHQRFTAIIAEHGPEAIAPLNYSGPHGMLAGGSMDRRFFHRLGATRLLRNSLCGGVRSTAFWGTYGAVPAMRPEHAAEAKLIVAWGNNVTVSNLHLMPIINEAKRQGARLVVVDPRRTKIAEQAHLHLPLLPGTDVVLALALAAELERTGGLDREFIAAHVQGAEAYLERAREFSVERAAEICGLEEGAIRQLAEWYSTLSPAAIAPGNGAERNRNGGSGFWALFALPALAGKFGPVGGGLVYGASNAFPKTLSRLTGEELAASQPRTFNLIDMGRLLLEPSLAPPIKGLFIYNHNPVNVHPDQNMMVRGLAREDLFTVVAELVHTDTVDYADIVLPNASNFEHGDIYPAYGQHFLQRAEAVIPPVGEALPNTEMFRRLAARFGFDEPALRATDEQLMDEALNAEDPRLEGHHPSQIPLEAPLSMTFNGEEARLFVSTFPATPSGKVELESALLHEAHGISLPGYQPLVSAFPLALISPASNHRTTSSFGGLPASDGGWLEMHPQDAQTRKLTDGGMVRIWNELGEVHLPLRITDAVRPGVVSSDKGGWFRASGNGRTVSSLAPATHSDLCEGACFNDARVEVSALHEPG